MEYGYDYFQHCLEELRPRIKNYAPVWAILRARAQRHRGQFPHRYHQLLRRFFDPERPYFIAKTSDGTLYLGDTRELYAVVAAADPARDAALLGFLRERAEQRTGACLDIGANMGLVAASIARAIGGDREVVAFEPVPQTARRAAATFALNRLRNVRLFVCAVGEVDGEIEFYATPNNSEWASTSPIGNPNIEWVKTTVPCCRLDTLNEDGRFGQVGAIKVDVEGYEPRVLKGAQTILSRDKPDIVFEYNHDIAPKLGWSPSDIAQIVRSPGKYRLHVLDEHSRLAPLPPSELQDTGFVNIYCEPLPTAG